MANHYETVFVETYIKKEYQERLLFELKSPRKREKALSRFAYDVKKLFKPSILVTKIAIEDAHIELQNKNEKTCYLISGDEHDGQFFSIDTAFQYFVDTYMPMILVHKEQAFLKEEVENNCIIYWLRSTK